MKVTATEIYHRHLAMRILGTILPPDQEDAAKILRYAMELVTWQPSNAARDQLPDAPDQAEAA